MKKSRTLVLVQFACIAYFLFHKGLFPNQNVWLLIEVIGVVLGLWAIYVVQLFNVSTFTESGHYNQLIFKKIKVVISGNIKRPFYRLKI